LPNTWYIFRPKISIWETWGLGIEKVGTFLCPFGIFYGSLIPICIIWPFGIFLGYLVYFFPVWVFVPI
jgi:hypothetical protein